LIASLPVFLSIGQITINNTLYTPTQLANGVLIPNGSGTTVANVNFRGVYNVSSRYQVGYFSTAGNTLSQMGFSSGVYITSGNTSEVPLTLGSNPGASAQMSRNYTSGTAGEIRSSNAPAGQDMDAQVLMSPYSYYNAAILEFDFVPVTSQVSFRYIFSSEEYNDQSGSAFAINYNCSAYNDKFAFLISGPGISGGQGYINNAENIARLGNGSEVGINSVNDGIVGSSGSPQNAGICAAENPGWTNGTPTPEFLGFIDGLQYNGNTRILTASKTGLTPGATYHIRLIVADANDGAYDSGVFLEAGSFTTLSCTNPTAPTIGSITQPSCTTPSATVTLGGLPANGTWTITSSPGGMTISGTGTTANFTSLSPSNNYSFIVTNEEGCTSQSSASANISAIPSNPTTPLIGTVIQPSCNAPTGSVNLSGLPSTGSWTITSSPGSIIQNGSGTSTIFTGLNPGNSYSFTVTNSFGCTSPSSANALINAYTPTPPVIGMITQPNCNVATGSVELSGLPAAGNWEIFESVGNTSITGSGTTATFTGLTSGTYNFIVEDNINCPSGPSLSAVINQQPTTPSAPIIGTVTQPTCLLNTGAINLTGLPVSGSWTITSTPGGNINGTGISTTISGLTAGSSYTFSVINTAGCSSSTTLPVLINTIPNNPSSPIIGTITQPSCLSPFGSAELSGLPAGNWTITASPGGAAVNGSGSTTTFSGLLPSTTYTFIVTNISTLCTSPASGNAVINIYSPAAPIVGTITQPTCADQTGSVDLSGLPNGNWTLTASPGGFTFSDDVSNFNFPGLVAGNYTFTVTDNSGCISPPSIQAVINPQPTTPDAPIIGTIVQPSCSENTGSIQLTDLPTGNWVITAAPGGTTNGSGSTYIFNGLTANTSYTYTVTSGDGCTSPTSLQAILNEVPTPPGAPIIGTITHPNCTNPNGSVQLNGLPATGQWVVNVAPGGGNLVNSGSEATFIGLSADNTYTFTVTDVNGCISSPSLSAVINDIPAAPVTPSAAVTIQPTCTVSTGTIQVTLPAGANYEYNVNGSNYQSSPTFSGLIPGTYLVSVADLSTGCISATTSLVVNEIPSGPAAPVVSVTAQPTCLLPSGTFEIVSPIGVNYTYSCNGITQTTTTFTGLLPGQNYSVTVSDVTTGCVSNDFDVTFNSIPTPELVNAGADYTISIGESVTLTASGNGTMVWNNGDITSTTVSPSISTTYTVTLTDANGCTDTDDATVYIAVDCGDLYIPNAFSPNNNSMNDSFKVRINADCVEEFSIKIFDRWGQIVFNTSDITKGWDGKYKDKELDPAIFVYIVDIKLFTDSEIERYQGNLTLFK
jgi:gliding motility-associated-like protein